MHLFADWLDNWFSARTLGVALWVGLAAMTVILLILTRTRWGQAKPLSKCVALSVFAHVLLIGYAYGTRLIFDYPDLTADDPVELKILANDRENESPDDSEEEVKPWNQFVTQDTIRPEVFQPDRQAVQRGETVERNVQAAAPSIEAAASQDAAQQHAPQRPVAEPSRPNVPKPASPVDQLASVERPEASPQPVENKTFVGPSASDLPRMHNVNMQLPNFENQPAIRNPAGTDIGTDPQLPGLSNIPFAATSADALKAARDAARRDLLHNNLTRNASSPETGNDTLASGAPATSSADVADKDDPSLRRLGDGQALPEAYRLRFSGDRLQVARQSGGSEQTEAAVQAALKWLASQQKLDGRWDANVHGAGWETKVLGHDRQGAGADADTAITGLALLAFLGAGHTHFEGKYDTQVRRGLEFLLATQATDGNLYGKARFFARMYCHGMATLAISEAFAITGDHRLKPYVERAVDYSVAAQHPRSGGWRYHPGDEIGDMSQFGWQVMSLKSAEMAGVAIPHATRDGMLKFLRNCSTGPHGGLAGYRPGEIPSRTMTAEALVCRIFLDQADSAAADEAATFLDQQRPDSGTPNLYYWYYATLGLQQINDGRWDRWNEALQAQLIRRQKKHGRLAGSWDHDTVWGAYGGRVYSTALATLCLESYYRYLPLFKQ